MPPSPGRKASVKMYASAQTRQGVATNQADARNEANTVKREAEYKVAIEKCDALAGTAKDSCVSAAKTHYGKS